MNRLLALATALALSATPQAFAGGSASDTTVVKSENMGGMMQGRRHAPGPMMLMPMMDSENGLVVFATKGCAVCHSVNGVGGDDAPSLDAETMNLPMNPFDFVARMWRGAAPMIAMQEDELGEQIEFTGQDLADLIAFMHDPAEQKNLSIDDIPPGIRKLIPSHD